MIVTYLRRHGIVSALSDFRASFTYRLITKFFIGRACVLKITTDINLSGDAFHSPYLLIVDRNKSPSPISAFSNR